MPASFPTLRAIAGCVALLPLFAATAAPEYRMTRLGPSQPWSWTTAINNHGVVVGEVGAMKGKREFGARFVGTRAHAIDFQGKNRAYPYALNDDGLAVGQIGNHGGGAAVFYGRRPERLFDRLAPQTIWARLNAANDINARGQIVGDGETVDRKYRAFLYENGVATVLEGLSPESESEARAIDAAGNAVGSSTVPGTQPSISHAVIFRPGTTQDLGSLGGESWATNLNNRGVVVGASRLNNGAIHSFIYRDGGLTDLGTLPGYNRRVEARAINEDNDIVGAAAGTKGRVHAFLHRNGRLYDLNDIVSNRGRWVIVNALDINESGVIAAMAYDKKSKKPIAVRLDPVK